jgi:hypothetical protein
MCEANVTGTKLVLAGKTRHIVVGGVSWTAEAKRLLRRHDAPAPPILLYEHGLPCLLSRRPCFKLVVMHGAE